MKTYNIAIAGTGYVGLSIATLLSKYLYFKMEYDEG